MIKETTLFPGTIAVWQVINNCYYVYFTGGSADPSKWIFGNHQGNKTYNSRFDMPKTRKKISNGIYSL